MRGSKMLRAAFGDEVIDHYVHNAEWEQFEYDRRITDWELKRGFEQVELVAVNQCSGNRRGLSDPHVPGVEWGYGAMGNARWMGVPLKEVLARAEPGNNARQVSFDGLDTVLMGSGDFGRHLQAVKDG